jgi:hypothetical protein
LSRVAKQLKGAGTISYTSIGPIKVLREPSS